MTQREELLEAIKHLELAVDTFPDKDDEIRRYNQKLESIIMILKRILKT